MNLGHIMMSGDLRARSAGLASGAVRAVRALIVLVAAGYLAGCAGQLEDIGRAPKLSPVGEGLEKPAIVPPPKPRDVPARLQPASLWRDTSADLFKDRRARRVGDVITVTISIKDKATLDNSTERTKDSEHNLGFELGYSKDWNGSSSSGTANADSKLNSGSEHKGKGAIERSETIDFNVAAVVTGVLPNGNLIIQGKQEIRVNYELRVLQVTGIVDLRDITAENTVPYERIAEARVSYGGRGRNMEVQQPGWLHQFLDIASPI
ncbi:MAG: flagellar basal body L-ring protein FlgH [Pseudomonadota bacterium]